MNQQQKSIPSFRLPFINNINDRSTTDFNILPTTMTTNHNNTEQYVEITLNSNEKTAIKTTNVNDGRQNQRDSEKGERENREDDVMRTWTMRERTKQTNKYTDSVMSFINEQYNCPNVNNSMTNQFSSSFNSKNYSLSNNRSRYPMTRHFREYEPSYPSINRYRTSLSSSPYRKTHYLDDSDEEIINEEILEIINLNRYPTLTERWGDDTKPIIRQEGEFKIEDYVEFEEIEPTISEEIDYEIIYSGDQIISTREIHHSRSESRNFRKLKKRRIKRKRTTQTFNDMHNLLQQTYEIRPSIINVDQSPNIDLIDEDTLLQCFKSDEERKGLFGIKKQEYQNNIEEEEIDESHVSSNDHAETSINESNDSQIIIPEKESQLQTIASEVTQALSQIETPIQWSLPKDELPSSSIDGEDISPIQTDRYSSTLIEQKPKQNSDQDLQSFLNSLLSHLVSDSVEKNEQSTLDDYTDNSMPFDQTGTEKVTIDHQLSTQFESIKPIQEQISSDYLTELVRQIRNTPLIIHRPPTDNQTDITPIFKQDKFKHLSSIDVKTEDNIVHHEPEDEKQFDSTTTEYVQQSSYDIKEATVPTDFPATLLNIHLPLADITTGANYVVEQKDESITPNSINETAETTISGERQLSIPPQTKEDENVELSSDFLADIVRQIINTTSTTHLSSPNHTKQVIAESTDDGLTEQTCITLIPTTNTADNKLLESNEIFPTISHSNVTDIDDRTEPKSSVQNDTPDELELLTVPINFESSNFISIDNEQLDEKKISSDLTKIYYELQEHRHIQPVFDEIRTDQKQEILDANLNNHSEPFDLKSFSLMSNLPSSEYHQVFGVPEEIINTVDDHQSVVAETKEELINETIPNITSNVELDFRYSQLFDRISTLIKPLVDLPSSSFITQNEPIPSNAFDCATTVITDVISNIVKSSPLTTINEENTTIRQILPTVDQITSPAESANPENEVIVSTSNEEIATKIEEEDQQTEASETLLQSATTDEEEHQGVFNLVAKAMPNLDSFDEQIVEEFIDNADEKNIPEQKQDINSNDPGYSSQYKVPATEFDRLSTNQTSSIIDHQQQNESETKLSYQQLQVINDDYPWYSSYYTIVDAEAKIARLYKQLNLSSEQPLSPTAVVLKTDLQDEEDFHIVQRRKRIPSSTTHEKTLPSSIITTKSTLSPDIDLEPVILHGHPDTPIPISPLVSQITDTTSKKKHKKKKKDKKEIILFDAPELTSSDINKDKIDAIQSEIVEEEYHQENNEINNSISIDQTLKHELEQLHPIPSIISDEQKPETLLTSTTSDTLQWLSNPVITLPEDVKVNAELIEQQSTDKEPLLRSSPASTKATTKTIHTKVIVSTKREEEEEDNEGFQLVRGRRRILSAGRSEQSPPFPTTASKQILSSGIEQKTSVTNEHQSLTSKKKRNKHKKHKKEIDSSSNIDSSKVEQEPADQETILQSHISSSSSIIEDLNVQSNATLPPTMNTMVIHTKLSASTVDKEDKEDNEGFQVVSYRKRITSAPRFERTPPSLSSLPKTTYKQNISRDIDLKPIVVHGRHGSAPRSIPHTTTIIETISRQNKQVKPKQDKKQTLLLSTPPRSASVETHIISTRQQTSDEYQQRLKNLKPEMILDVKPEYIVKEHSVSTNEEIKTEDQQPSIKEIVPSTALSVNNADTYTENDSSLSTIAPEMITVQTTTTPEKKEDTLSSLITDIDLIPFSVEETTDHKASDDIQHVPEPQMIPANSSSNSDETITSQINESMYLADDTQSRLHSIKSVTSASIPQVSSTDVPATTNPVEQEETLPSPSLEPTLNTEDEHIKSTSNKKSVKRRKKKSHTKGKAGDENVLTSSTNTTATTLITPTNIASNVQRSDSVKSESNRTTVQQPETIATTTQSFSSPLNTSEILSDEINNKLDLFLPEYIRRQINTRATTSSLPIDSITTSSDITHKKKQRHKMLNKDHEAKSLLTSEFDNTINTEKQPNSTDDEFSNPTNKSEEKPIPISTEGSTDNILSRGFYRWLQESQAISQQKDTSSSSTNSLTHAMQSIIIQPVETHDNEENEDSWNASKTIKPSYMIDTHSEKRIHNTNAYSINHPDSITTPSWLIAQSNENTSQDNPENFDSDNEKDSMNDDISKKQSDSNNTNHQQTNVTTDDVQQCLGEDVYRQIDHNPSANFDDWAHFLEEKNSYHIGDDLSTSLEYFYTQTYDEDTLLSDTIPIHGSIKNERQRYGDFLPSNNDESMIKPSLSKYKPSEYFQNRRKQESTSIQDQSDNDNDEIFISHSNDGLSRRMKP